jgi:hypothetical protein
MAARIYQRRNEGRTQAEFLDIMELLAGLHRNLRQDYIAFLRSGTGYSPAWDGDDAGSSLAQMLEMDHDPQALALLDNMAHAAISSQDDAQAEGFIERIEDFGGAKDLVEALKIRLRRTTEARTSQRIAKAVKDISGSVMYIGGNEVQARLGQRIQQGVSAVFPSVVVKFEHTGWSSQIGPKFERIEQQIERCKAVVMCSMMRTNMGRKVRVKCKEVGLTWRTHTGTGAESAIRTILDALRDL